MIDTAGERRIKKLTDDELEFQMTSANRAAYIASLGIDDEARIDAQREYAMLDREWQRRIALKLAAALAQE